MKTNNISLFENFVSLLTLTKYKNHAKLSLNRIILFVGLILSFFVGNFSWAQITTTTWNFNANATGWTGNITRTTATSACGSASMRRNLYSTVTTGNLVSPQLPGTNNQGVITLSYDYKAANWSANTVGTNPWGYFNVQYGATATGPWTTLATVSQETQNGSCITKTHTFTPPAGNIFLKWDCFWTSGDYYINFDNITVSQATPLGCSGTPLSGISAISFSSGCSGQNITLSNTGSSAGLGITYNWQSSLNNSTWTNITGATAATTVITSPAAFTYYRLVTTCSNSGLSANSNTVTFNGVNCSSNNVPASGNNLVNCGTSTMLYDFNGASANYNNNYDGYTVLDNSGSGVITLTGSYATESGWDYLYIYSGTGTLTLVGGPYSGTGNITPVSSAAGQPLTVRFSSDGSTVNNGFSLQAIYTGTCAPPSAPSCIAAPSAPANAATGITTNQVLSWPAASGATGYNVYFGTTSPPALVSSNQASTTYTPTGLLSSTNYYWQIVPTNSVGVSTGCAIWSFSTGVAGCPSGTSWLTYTPVCNGLPEQYSTCTYAGEYNTLTLSAGQTYTFTSSTATDYLTVRNGATILVAGVQPVIYTAPSAGNYTVQVNTNSACGTDANCHAVSVQCGTPPTPNWLAQFISMNTGSSTWCTGEVRTVTVTVKNNGQQTWTNSAPDINIGVKWNADSDYFVRADANGLAPGATGTFTLAVTAPTVSGVENLSFDVVNELNFWFGNNNNGGGPGNSVYTSSSITIISSPTLSALSSTTACLGSISTLTATSPQNNNVIMAENFAAGNTLAGWTIGSSGTNWGSLNAPVAVYTSNLAGGIADEAAFTYNTTGNGVSSNTLTLSYGPINTTGITSLTLTYKQFLDNFDAVTYPYTISVRTSTNNTSWNTATSSYNVTNPAADIAASTNTVTITNANVGSSTFYFAFVVTGNTWGMDGWNIDDVVLTAPVSPALTWSTTTGLYTNNLATTSYTGSNTNTVYSNPPSTQNYTVTANNAGCTNTVGVTVNVNLPSISPTPAAGDYVWNGQSSVGWSIPGNWYVYTGTGYSVATAASTSSNNVIISPVGTCIIQQPIVSIPGLAQNVTINSGASLTMNSASTISAKNLTIASNATLSMNAAGGNTLNLSGNWQDNGTFIAGVGTVNFNGTTAQSISKSSGNEIFTNVIVNKSSGGLSLNSPTEINTNITFTSGLLNSDPTNLLIINDNATIVGASNTSHVVGPVRKIGNDAFTFPVGKAGNYAPASISAPSLTTDHFTAEYFNTDPNPSYNRTQKDNTLNNISACEYWIIDRTAGSSAVTVNLSWNTPRSCGVNALNDLRVARWDGSMWKDHGNGGTTGNTTTGDVSTSAVVNNFSPFTLSSTSGLNPLPIELTKFELNCENNKVVINWSTASEINNNYYTIERSFDGINFESIAIINGNGTSYYKHDYSYTDVNSLGSLVYYRLKQTDFDGQSKTYNLKSIQCENINSDVIISPNPNCGIFFIEGALLGSELIIKDVLGKIIYQSKVNEQKKEINLNNLSKGIYYINISDNLNVITKKIIIN